MTYKEKINNFIKNNSNKNKVIVIYWPTACGKTWLWIDIAKYLNTEIISTDSRQIYKYLNIWTWKATLKEMSWIPHHMIDIILPDEFYSVWEFKNQSEIFINKLYNENKIPILVWWTGLYIDSLIYDFDIPKVIADDNLRKSLEDEALKYGKIYVYEKLKKLDPEYAIELHPNNLNYVIRALEVKILTWKSKKDFRTEKKLKYDTLLLTPYDNNRDNLYKNINNRVQKMFDDWLIKEVENILNMWYFKNAPWLNTIWYKEVIELLNWEININECIEKVKQFNRNYAKRQLTWFNKYN